MRKFYLQSAILMTLLFIAGCTTKPNLDYSQKITAARVSNLNNWIASGKILIVENGEKQSANFYWQQKGKDYTFSLSTFLGIDLFSLQFKNGLAEIKTNGETYSGTDPKDLLLTLTGHHIPLANMPAWLLGFADSKKAKNKTYDQNKRLLSFDYVSTVNNTEQFSVPQLARVWSVNYQSRTQTKMFTLPKLVSIESEATRIKLSISKWQY